jgi:hypothetical protein
VMHETAVLCYSHPAANPFQLHRYVVNLTLKTAHGNNDK